MTKFIFVTGGVCSGIGKGIVSASIGNLLTRIGYSVTILKADPYINVDPGTMNPKQHGEVFVTQDGAETDLDLGHYERFIQKPLTKLSSISTGQVYQTVINKERRGDYQGGTVQIMDITDEIKSRVYTLASHSSADFVITEIGGTVGDIESIPFLEAVRQIVSEEDPSDTCTVHLGYVPFLGNVGEHKTKPLQHSVKELRSLGLIPDILVTRSEISLEDVIIQKLVRYCYVKPYQVVQCPNSHSLYRIPKQLWENGIITAVSDKLDFVYPQNPDSLWDYLAFNTTTQSTKICMVGKYSKLQDSYLSVTEALKHAGASLETYVDIHYVDVTDPTFTINPDSFDGFIIPGGFGDNGVEDIIDTLETCRTLRIPTLGICLGMQLMCIEYFRNVVPKPDLKGAMKHAARHEGANSTEFDEFTPYPIIDILPDKKGLDIGGTLRLGTYPTKIYEDTLLHAIYDQLLIYERHRHRYEVNNTFRGNLVNSGLVMSGVSPDKSLVEVVELPQSIHPFYIGTQFHPEFQSYLTSPSPIFLSFVEHCLRLKGKK